MIEKQTDRKIKILQINSAREYKNQFIRFGQDNSIGIHFKIEKHGLANKMNRSLLEKVQYLFSNVSLDKTFWAEALMHTNHLMNCMSLTAIGGKTPLDNWLGKASQEYSLLQVFESPAYFSAK